MTNPFDSSFLKFFIGFVCILTASFCMLYVVSVYGVTLDTQTAQVGQ